MGLFKPPEELDLSKYPALQWMVEELRANKSEEDANIAELGIKRMKEYYGTDDVEQYNKNIASTLEYEQRNSKSIASKYKDNVIVEQILNNQKKYEHINKDHKDFERTNKKAEIATHTLGTINSVVGDSAETVRMTAEYLEDSNYQEKITQASADLNAAENKAVNVILRSPELNQTFARMKGKSPSEVNDDLENTLAQLFPKEITDNPKIVKAVKQHQANFNTQTVVEIYEFNKKFKEDFDQSIEDLKKAQNNWAEVNRQYHKEVKKNHRELTSKVDSLARSAQEQIKRIEEVRELIRDHPDIKEQKRWTRFLMDHFYSDMTTQEKIMAIKEGYYPQKAAEIPKLMKQLEAETLIREWQQFTEKVDTVVQCSLIGVGIAQQLGVKVPRGVQRAFVASQGFAHVAAGIALKNPLQLFKGLQAVFGAFAKQQNLQAAQFRYFAQRFDRIDHSLQQIQQTLDEIARVTVATYNLCQDTVLRVNKLGQLTIEIHQEQMRKLNHIHFDLLFNREIMQEEAKIWIRNLEKLLKKRAQSESYQFQQGRFKTHKGAELFFKHYFSQFDEGMNHLEQYLRIESGDLAPAVRFETDVQANISHNAFREEIWLPTRHVWQSIAVSEKNLLMHNLFNPPRFVEGTSQLLKEGETPSEEFTEIQKWVADQLVILLAPQSIIRFGDIVCETYGYDALLYHSEKRMYTLDELTNPTRKKFPEEQRGLRLLTNLCLHVHLSIAQQHLISGVPLLVQMHRSLQDKINSPSEEHIKGNDKEFLKTLFKLLQNNICANQNLMLYLIYQTLNWKENDSRLLSYRFAFNHSSDPSELEKLFPKSWRFQPRNDDNGRGWDLVVSLHFEGDEEPSKLLLHLPSPNQLAIGRLTYPYELSGLLELKERVIQLLAVCQLTSSKLDEKLQKILVERVITQSS